MDSIPVDGLYVFLCSAMILVYRDTEGNQTKHWLNNPSRQ